MDQRINLDYSNMSFSAVGKQGFKEYEIEEMMERLIKIKSEVTAKKKSCQLEFACLPYAAKNLEFLKDKALDLGKKFDTLCVVGIGGSDLGTRAVYGALGSKNGKKLKFLGNTVDPEALKDFLDSTNLKKTCFNFVSRSGETVEILAHFNYFEEKLDPSQIIITTGAKGYLSERAKTKGYFVFNEPENVGDRFSVLSVVSLFPLAFVGIDINRILDGSVTLANHMDDSSVREDPMMLFSTLIFLSSIKRKQNTLIIMPYSYRLLEFGRWFRQLFAESLGKNKLGITPIDLAGPTDQHSFLQLLNDGPKDKVVLFVKTRELQRESELENAASPVDYKIPELKGLKDKTFLELLGVEYLATSKVLCSNQVPNCTLLVSKVDEYNLGQLFYFFEIATSYLGHLFGIDPYSQPGVEENKRLIEEILKGKKSVSKPSYLV